MKKLLLSLAAVLSFGAMAYAEDVTEVFNQTTFGEAGWPTSAADRPQQAKEFTSPETDIKYEVYGCYVNKGNTKDDSVPDYLMFPAKTQKDSYISFSLDFDCQELILKTSTLCSTKPQSKVYIYAGTNQLTELALDAQGQDFKVAIPQQYRAAGTVYKIQSATTGYNQQLQSITYVEQTKEPSISADAEVLNFSAVKGDTQTLKFKAIVENIKDEITATTDNDVFSVSPASFNAVTGGNEIEVTFAASAAGEYIGTLTLAAGELSTTVALNAYVPESEGNEASPFTLAEVIKMNNINYGPFCVKGLIYEKTAANAQRGILQFAETAAETNIVLYQVVSEEETIYVPVALPGGDARDKLNIVQNPDNVDKEVVVKGTLESYFLVPGVKNTQLIELVGIESVAVDANNAAAEYFNLQGVRVEEPANGLYIVRRGDKVSKEIVR